MRGGIKEDVSYRPLPSVTTQGASAEERNISDGKGIGDRRIPCIPQGEVLMSK